MANARSANVLVLDTTTTIGPSVRIKHIIAPASANVTIATAEGTTIWTTGGALSARLSEDICIRSSDKALTVTVTAGSIYLYLE